MLPLYVLKIPPPLQWFPGVPPNDDGNHCRLTLSIVNIGTVCVRLRAQGSGAVWWSALHKLALPVQARVQCRTPASELLWLF